MLKKLGIVSGNDTKAGDLFEKLFPDVLKIDYKTPSDFINKLWTKYSQHTDKNNNLNGKIFEYIIATLCIREEILPFYLSAKVAFVPNVIFDLMFYSAERGPICLSIKTSLRERYKQADLEAIALKYVHRKAICHLITLEEKEAKSVKEKIKTGDVIGLDNVILASDAEFDDLIKNLKLFILQEPPTVKVIQSNQIVTKDIVNNFLKL